MSNILKSTFLENPLGMALAGRNSSMTPNLVRVIASQALPETNQIKVFIPYEASKSLLEGFAVNGMVSFVASSFISFETYQFKGTYAGHQEATPTELEFQKNYNEKVMEILTNFGIDTNGWNNYGVVPPIIVLTFDVQEVFEQTPKKGTGGKLNQQ